MLIVEPSTACVCCLDSLIPQGQQKVLSVDKADACPMLIAAVDIKVHCHAPRSAQPYVTCAQHDAV